MATKNDKTKNETETPEVAPAKDAVVEGEYVPDEGLHGLADY